MTTTPRSGQPVLDTTDATGSVKLVVNDGDEVSLPGRALLVFRKTQ